jgi:hypothetical protein
MENLTEREKALAKEILEKVYDHTMDKEVGMRYILHKIAKEYGVELNRRFKRCGNK